MDILDKLKQMIDEENYPYFEDIYLQELLNGIDQQSDVELKKLARTLCIKKAGIEELKIGDITIPSPKKYFLMLANKYKENQTKVITRKDET